MKKTKTPKWMNWQKQYKGGPLASLDIEILKFLWKWKLAPSSVLHQALAPETNPNTFNKRIKKLENNNLIQCHTEMFYGFQAWGLCEFGFYVVKESLGNVRDHGFKSASLPHDRLVLAFQLGEWIWQKDPKPLFITDQELMKYPADIISRLVPTPKDHRPDGYTVFLNQEKKKVFAVEVELHAKTVSRYHTLIAWYSLQKEITQVLWLIGDPFALDQVLKAKAEAQETSQNYHVFVDLNEYLKDGWDAMIRNENGRELYTMRDLWRGIIGLEQGENTGTEGALKKIETFTDHKKFLKV